LSIQFLLSAFLISAFGSAEFLLSNVPFTTHIDKISESDWNDLLLQFADASIYQTWAYGAVHWGRTQLSHLVLKRNGEIVAATQVRIVQIPIIKKGVAYIRWGPLWRLNGLEAEIEIFSQALSALKREYVEKRGLLLRIIPNVFRTDSCAPSVLSLLAELGFSLQTTTPAYHTMRLDLSKSIEDIRKGLHQRWRNKLKNAEKSGFTVSIQSDDAAYQRFLDAYHQMMSRKRFETTVDPTEFARIQSTLPGMFKMQVLLCEKDGELFNALVVAPAGDTAIYLLAATANAGLQANGAFLLQWKAIEMLKQDGRRWYDLGGVNPLTNPGVYQFKSGIGGEDVMQSGLHTCDADWITSLCVTTGEALRSLVKKKRKSETSKPEPVLSPANSL
jgi:lipid II:glycine glycyltransferase (peptidoglycan interpeptide bridge formation enzyme)